MRQIGTKARIRLLAVAGAQATNPRASACLTTNGRGSLAPRAPGWPLFDERGVVILPGGGRARTRLSWYCLEGMPAFLKDRGWVLVGRTSSSESDLGTLGEYLSTCGMGGSAYRVAAVLQAAGIVEVEHEHPLRVRLRSRVR